MSTRIHYRRGVRYSFRGGRLEAGDVEMQRRLRKHAGQLRGNPAGGTGSSRSGVCGGFVRFAFGPGCQGLQQQERDDGEYPEVTHRNEQV